MAEDRLITVAIHTYDYAVALKTFLEGEGVKAVLQNVNLSEPVVSPGVRVRILESDLPKALRIIENRDIFIPRTQEAADTRRDHRFILVPIDFTDHSLKAVDFAFNVAMHHRSRIVFITSFLDPDIVVTPQLSNTLSYDIVSPEMRHKNDNEAHHTMLVFAKRLRERIKSGELPAVKFSTEVLEGIPEEVITEYAKAHTPSLIVMGTRKSEQKERELVGSVTAEVLDSCRLPIITIPATTDISQIGDLKHVELLCNLDQGDILAMDALYSLFSDENVSVTLLSLPDKKGILRRRGQSMEPLIAYCKEHYPRFDYHTATVSPARIVDDFERIRCESHIDFLVIPNKKKIMFARLFNPSVAHRILFNSDIPMMVVPV
jgi:nucleotide-binding universal stress UspA family protein